MMKEFEEAMKRREVGGVEKSRSRGFQGKLTQRGTCDFCGRLLAMKELCFMREFYSGKPEAIWVVGIL